MRKIIILFIGISFASCTEINEANEIPENLPIKQEEVNNLPEEEKEKRYTCTQITARFANENEETAERLLGKADEFYRNDYWYFLVWYDKVSDEFDNDAVKHLGIKFPTIMNNQRPVIECIEHGGVFHMGTSYLRLP